MADEKRRLKVWMMETGGWGGIHYYAHALCNALEDCSVDLAMLTTEANLTRGFNLNLMLKSD